MLFSSILILQRNKKNKRSSSLPANKTQKTKNRKCFLSFSKSSSSKTNNTKKTLYFFSLQPLKDKLEIFFLLSPPKPSVCSPPLPTDSAPFSSFLFANAFFSSLFQNFPSPLSTFGSPFINKPKLPFSLLFFHQLPPSFLNSSKPFIGVKGEPSRRHGAWAGLACFIIWKRLELVHGHTLAETAGA